MRVLRGFVGVVLLLLVAVHPGQTRAQSQPVRVLATVEAYRVALVAGKIDAALDLTTENAVFVTPMGVFSGRTALRGFFEMLLQTQPGLSITFSEIVVAHSTQVHRAFVSSEAIRSAGVERIVLIDTFVTMEGKIVSETEVFDLSDAQTVRFLAVLAGG